MSATNDVPVQDVPIRRTSPSTIPEEYDRLRTETPIARRTLFDGSQAWLVTRMSDAREILTDPAMSADRTDERFPMLRSNRLISLPQEKPLNCLDGNEHVQYRRLVASEFTAKRVSELRPRMQAVIDGVIDHILERGTEADIVHDLALPIASTVISELLGVPHKDQDFFQHQSSRLIQRYAPPEEFQDALSQLGSYIAELVRSKADAPPDDGLISRLHSRVRNGELRESQLVSLSFLLLLAGHETSANVIALGVFSFLSHPEKLDELRDQPDLYPAAVNELLRYHSITDDITARFATTDTELSGTNIESGDKVVVSAIAANHDPEAFRCPAQLDFHREEADSVAFGYGAHTCLGQNLARAELAMTFQTLFERIPGLRLVAPIEELDFKYDSVTWGLESLPVAWGPTDE